MLLSYLLLIKENESNFSLFVSKIATRLSGTSSSEWTLDFPITIIDAYLYNFYWIFNHFMVSQPNQALSDVYAP